MNKKVKFAGLIALAATFLAGMGVFAFNALGAGASEPIVAEAATTVSNASGWNTAMAGTGTIEITLGANWTATENTTTFVSKFGDGTYFKDGALYIPSGKTVVLDLNAKTLNRNQKVDVDGGCVIYNDGNLTIKGTGTITGGYNSLAGGGIVNNGTLTMNGGTISNNKTALNGTDPQGGGGIYSPSGSTLTIKAGVTITENTAANTNGGGIVSAGTLTISGGTISNNIGKMGGGLRFLGSSLSITGGTFNKNHSTTCGGGAYLSLANAATISGVSFTNNESDGHAAGLGFGTSSGLATLTNITATGNTAVTDGGGLYFYHASANIGGNSKFNGNTARCGGGISFTANGANNVLTIANTTINDNLMYAANNLVCHGAGISTSSGTLKLRAGTTISGNHTSDGNTALNPGAGIWTSNTNVEMDGGTATSSVTIENNAALYSGGGAYIGGSVNFTMTGNVYFNWNTCGTGFGGAIWTDANHVTISGGKFYRNGFVKDTKTIKCGQSGAIYFGARDSAVRNITKCTFESNAANGYGGAILSNNGTLNVGTVGGNNADIVFKDNYSGNLGGAINAWRGAVTVNSGTFEYNSAKSDGGGAISANNTMVLTIKGGLYQHNGYAMTGAYAVSNTTYSGGAVYAQYSSEGPSTVKISGGTFTDNRANGLGGAIRSNAHLEVSSGTFTSNQSVRGSVIFGSNVGNCCEVTISGGSMTGNTASGDNSTGGGAVYMESGTQLTISGGTIQNNTTTNTTCNINYAAAVMTNGALNMSGSPVISGNKQGTTAANLYSAASINITGVIGSLNVSTLNKGVLTSGYNSVGKATSATLFKTDLSGYKVAYQSNEIVIVTSATDATKALVTPTISAGLTYNGSRQTIVSGYIAADMNIVSVKLTRYTTTAQSTLGTTVTTLSNTTNALGYSISGNTITATEAGKYEVVFSAKDSTKGWVKTDGTTATGNQTLTITITKKTIVWNVGYNDVTFNGTSRLSLLSNGAPSVTEGNFLNVLSGWTKTYYRTSVTDANKVADPSSDATYAKYAGNYYCNYAPVYKGDAGYNYYVASGNRRLSILTESYGNLVVTVTNANNIVYTGSALKPNFTISYGGTTMYTYNGSTGAITKNNETANGTLTFTVSYSNNTRPGTAKISIVITASTNFGTGTKEQTFTIKPMSMSGGNITGTPTYTASKTYDGTNTVLNAAKGTLAINGVSGVAIDGVVATYDTANVGSNKTITVRLVLSGADADLWDARLTYTNGAITAKAIGTNGSIATVNNEVYKGAAYTPEPAVTNTAKNYDQSSTTLTKDKDFTYSYSHSVNGAGKSTNVGTVTITVTGKGNYSGTMTKTFNITAKDIATDGSVAAVSNVTFDGAAHNATPAVTNSAKNATQASTTLTKDTDYTLSYSNSNGGAGNTTNAGTVTITVTGKGNYNGSMTKTFVINTKDIAGATVALTGNTGLIYNASAQKAGANVSIVLKTGDTATSLVSGTDFTLSYANAGNGNDTTATNAGTVTVTVTGNGNYSGTATSKPTYTIAKAEINSVTFNKTSFIYNNTAQKPATSAYATATTVNGTLPAHSAVLSVSAGQIDAGTSHSVNVEITSTYANNYKFASTVTNATTRTSDTVITRAYSIAKVKITAVTWSSTELTYSGNAQSPSVTAFTTEATVTGVPTAATIFEITGQQTNVGDTYKAVATIKSEYAGNYEFKTDLQNDGAADETAVAYKINPAQIVKIDATKELATAYTGTFDGENHDSVNKNAKTEISADNGSIKWYFKESAEGTVWFENMPYYKDAGTYQVWYKITATNHATVEGSDKYVTVTITEKNLSDAVIAAITSETYTGSAFTPKPAATIQLVSAPAAATTLVEGTDFTYSWSDNIAAGTATVTITYKAGSNYTGSKSATFTINSKDIAAATVTVDDIADEVYNGLAHEPTPVVNDSESGATLVDGTDYTFTYSANTAAGTATISFTGKGNYTGTTTKTFTITAKTLTGAKVNGGSALADETYAGAAIEPTAYTLEVELVSGTYTTLVLGTDYTLSYTDNEDVGTATITFTGIGNYSSTTTATFEITNAAITASITESELSWTYDGKTHKISLGSAIATTALADTIVDIYIGYSLTGSNSVTLQLATGDTEPADWTTVTAASLTFKDVSDSSKVWYRLTADNHAACVGSFEIEIDRKEITGISGLTFVDRDYDGTRVGTFDKTNPGTPVFAGILDDDTLTVESADSILFINKNVGTGKAVTATGVKLGGDSEGNYYIDAATAATGTASISKLKIVIEWHVDNFDGDEGLTIVYDGKAHKAVAKIKNLATGDLDGLSVRFNDSKVSGETVTLRDSYKVEVYEILNDSGNYSLEGVALEAKLEIVGSGNTIYRDLDKEKDFVYDGNEKKPSLYYNKTVDGVPTKVYIEDEADAFVTYAVDGVEGGKAIDAGSHSIILQLSPKYDWSGDLNGVFTLNIGKATLAINEITATGATVESAGVYTYTYNNTQYSLTEDWSNATINGKTLSEVFGSQACPDGVSVSYFYDNAVASGKTAAKESGYAVEIRFTVNGNYNSIETIKATMKIMRKAIDLDGVTFEGVGTGWTGLAINYDGTLKTVEAKDLPAEITGVSYEYFKGSASAGTDGVREVGAYSAVATLTFDSVNYKLVKGGNEVSNLSCDITVNPKSLDLSGVTYTGATDASGVTYDGEVHKVTAGNIPEGVTGVSYEYFNGSTSLGTTGVKNAGTYDVVVTFALNDNFGGGTTTVNKQIIINKATLSVTVNNSVIGYGDDAKNDGVIVNGLLGGDTAALLSLTYSYTAKVGGAAYQIGSGVGEYDIKVSCGALDNYVFPAGVTGTMTVKPREIQVKWQNSASDKNTSFEYVYSEGTTWAPYAYVANPVGSDGSKLTLKVSGGREDAAMNCTATVVGIEGDAAANYTLPTVEAKQTFNVLPSPRTGRIVWEEAEFVYNGKAQTPKAYYFENETDRVPKELTVTTNVSAVNAGHYTATASLGSNYDLQGDPTYEFDILARKVYVKILDASVRYSSNIDYSVLDWMPVEGSYEFVSGDVCNVTLKAVGVNGVGKFKIEGTFSTNNAKNYAVTFVGNHVDGDGGVLTVTQGKYDMTGVTFAGTEVTYDGQTHDISILGLPAGVTATLTYSKDGILYSNEASSQNKIINAGAYDVEIKFTGDSVNYEALTSVTATLTVKKAALTVKANNSTIVYGDEPKASGVTYSGFVNGENENQAGVISGTLLYTYTYTRYGNAGTYSVKATEGCLSAENYDIVYTAGVLTVKARELTVEWYADADKTSTVLKYVYDGLTHKPTAVIASGIVNNDTVTLTVSGEQTEIGENYTATATASNANYVVAASSAKAMFGIIPAEKYTLVWDHTPLVYNGEERKPNAYYYDADGNRQTINATDVTLNGAGVDVDNYTASVNVTVDGHALIGSYDYEILPAEVTITITNDKAVKYGETATFGTADWAVTAGTIYSQGSVKDDLKVVLETTADGTSNIGTYVIKGSYDNGNYVVTFVTGTLTVNKADVVETAIAFDNVDKVYTYDGTTHTAKIKTPLPDGVTGVRYEYTDKSGAVVSTEGVKNAGEYTVKAIFTVGSNYNAVAGTYTTKITINEKALSGITFDNKTVTYNGAAHTPALSGDFTAVTDVVYTIKKGTETVASAVNAGSYTVTVVLTIDKNYDASGIAGGTYDATNKTLTLTASLTIEKAELTVTAKDGVTVYGTAANVNGYGYTLRGFVNGENESAIAVDSATYSYADGCGAATANAGVYTGKISVSLTITSENYKMATASENGTLTITPKTISVEWTAGDASATVVNGKFVYVFDGKTHAPVATAKDESGNDIAGLTLTVSGEKSELGDNYTAKVEGLTGGNGNYALPLEPVTAQFSIVSEEENERDGVIIWDNTEHEYDGKAYLPTAYYFDGETKVDVTDLVTVDGGSAVDADSYIARVPSEINGIKFKESSTSMAFTITKRTVYIVIGDATTHYGTAVNLGAVSYGYKTGSAQFLEAYTIELNCAADATSSIGKYKIEGRFISVNAKNYNVVFSGSWASPEAAENGRFGTLTVERATYDISKVTFMDTEVTYDGNDHKVTVNGLPSTLTEDNYVCTYTSALGFGGSVDGVKNAGVYNVTIKFIDLDPNYEAIADMHTTLTIKKAALTVTANYSEVTYGEEPQTSGASYAGFVNDEDESVLGGELKYVCTYTRGASVGDYVITVSGLTAVNYEITYYAGTMRVIPRVVTVSWYYDDTLGTQELSYDYDGKMHAPIAIAGNLVAGDVVTITVTGEKDSIGKDFTATASAVSNANYTLPTDGSETVKFSIMPVEEKYVIWNYSELVYDGTKQMPHVYYLDENGKEVSLDEFRTVTINNGIAAGAHTVEIPLAKYRELDLNGDRVYNYVISKAKLTVTVKPAEMNYGGTPVFNGYTVDGTVYNSDDLKIVLDSVANRLSNVGEYEITATYNNSNYDITFVNGTFTVNKADVDESGIEFNNVDKEYTYDGNVYSAAIKELPDGVTGVRYEYVDALGNVVSAEGVKDVGVYTVRAIFTVDGNHNEITVTHSTTITIKKAEVDISNVVFDETRTLYYTGEKQEVFVSGTATGVSSVTYTYYVYDASKTDNLGTQLSEAPVNAGKYVVVAQFTALDNYDAAGAKLTMLLTVEKATLSITVNNKTLVYGTAADANGYGYIAQGLLADDDADTVLGGLTLGYSDAQHENVATYGIIALWNGTAATSFETDNYKVTVTNGTLTVTKYVITAADVEWTNSDTDSNKTFVYEEDGNEHKPNATVNISGITLAVSGGASVAGDYTATVTGVDNANYEVEAGITRSFKIVATLPEVFWTDTQFVYDGASHEPVASLADGTPLSGVTVVEGTAVDAGTYTAEIVYNGETYSTTFDITARKVYIVIDEVTTTYKTAASFAGAGRYLYDDAEKQFVSESIDSMITYRSTVPVTAPVGTYANMISGTYTGGANYLVTVTAGTLRILKAQYDMSDVSFNTHSVPYDGQYHALEVLGTPEGVTATISYYTSTSGWSYNANGVKEASVYSVKVTFSSSDDNYETIPDRTGTFEITKAPLTVTAEDNAIVYGDEPAASGVTYAGFVDGEDKSVLGGMLGYSFNYRKNGAAGTYAITPEGLTSDNYDIVYVSGVLTVEKRVVTVTWYKDSLLSSAALQYNYDGITEFKPYAVAGNTIAGDSVTLTVSGGQRSAGLAYLATVIRISNNNYVLPEDGSASVYFDVLPRAGEIVWENTEFVYDPTKKQAPGAYFFDANGEKVSLTVTVYNTDMTVNNYSVDADTYIAMVTGAPDSVSLSDLSGSLVKVFTIKQKDIKIKINSVVGTYGKLPAFDMSNWEYVGENRITDGNFITLVCAITGMTNPDAGTYVIEGKCSSDNYKVDFIKGTYTVQKAEISVPTILSKDFTGGLLTADVPASSMYTVLENYGGINVGSYRVRLSLKTEYTNNYKWADTEEYIIDVEFVINKATNAWTTPFEMDWVLDADAATLNANVPASKFGTPEVKFYTSSSYADGTEISESEILENKAQGRTYYVRVTVGDTANYSGLTFEKSIVIVGDRSLALKWETFEATYDGTEHKPKAYVTIDGEKVYLVVKVNNEDGKAVRAGDYTATVEFKAENGKNLSNYKLYEGAPSADKTISFTIEKRKVTVQIGDIDSVDYGTLDYDTTSIIVDLKVGTVSTIIEGSAISGNVGELDLHFHGTFENIGGFVNAGTYAIIGVCNNPDYDVTFVGSWSGADENNGVAGTYTVNKVNLTVNKTGSEWFDEENVIDRNQSAFVSLGEKDEESGEYKYIALKGNKKGGLDITYSGRAYAYDSDVVLTDDEIADRIARGQTTPPEITQSGDFVVYYAIKGDADNDNYNTKYGQWIIRIRIRSEFIIVNFTKGFTVNYGDVTDRDLLPDLIAQGCIEIGDGYPITLDELKSIAKAYAYEDVSDVNGYVDGATTVGNYTIKLVFNERIDAKYDNLEFKYSDSNSKPDTNTNQFKVTARELTLEWGETKFVYDGAEHIPTATLKGLLGGKTVQLKNLKLGVNTVEIDGVELIVTVSLFDGKDTKSEGVYMLQAEITSNENYVIKTGAVVAVSINDESKVTLPTWAIIAISAAAAVAVMITVIVIMVLRKRSKAQKVLEGLVDEEGFSEDYNG